MGRGGAKQSTPTSNPMTRHYEENVYKLMKFDRSDVSAKMDCASWLDEHWTRHEGNGSHEEGTVYCSGGVKPSPAVPSDLPTLVPSALLTVG
eukprot:120543-Pleurochrysis_carterae.AAC.2